MKRSQIFIPLLFLFSFAQAQLPPKAKKYPSLLWEISGKGMRKPSYLIGTMHVSSKLAFNLPDSFYMAVRSAEVVALETNPETWQEDMSKFDFSADGYNSYKTGYESYSTVPSDYLGINTLKFYKYDKKIERALYSNPSAINNLLYRSYGNESSDFEEDTYLDMYIFQCGKKWGKKIAGVESYGESMRLMAEAYRDAARDKNRKERSYGDWDDAYSSEKLQEAYRRGNLDLLDSINKYNSFSEAFDEKFLYRRNEIQAESIDSILKSGSTLFVGVGAAHLPGERGVIEILRRKGYKLRPIKMGERASREKELVDKVRVPVLFNTETAEDGFYKVDIPGKMHKFGDDASLNQQQFADMANGSYYLVTRIMTNAWMWNHNTDEVYRIVDSLLYENVPGKIITKTPIIKNGYKGFDVVNRTRRGDVQRYNIFVTPFEIIFFKMSGNGDYVRNGIESDKFFGSIRMKDYKNGEESGAFKKYTPSTGGFAVAFPHEPYIGNDGSWIYDAIDKKSGLNYRVIRTDIHNLHFIGEDTFDLALMEESFMSSGFVEKQLERKFGHYSNYPALDARYTDKFGNIYRTRYLIQGPHYYTLIAYGKESPSMDQFLNSFEIAPYRYGPLRKEKDTALYFTVNTTWFPKEEKIKLSIPRYTWTSGDENEDELSEKELLEDGIYRNRVISNDSTGERIYVSFVRSSRYHYLKDSSVFADYKINSFLSDTSFVYKLRKKTLLPDNTRIWETIVSDTGSSRTIWTKVFYKNGIGFTLATQSDSSSAASSFVQNFFESFTPGNLVHGSDPFTRKSAVFFADFHSKDSLAHKRAVKHIADVRLDSTDLPGIKKAIASLNWEERKYLETKKEFINKLSGIPGKGISDYLKQLYYALDDTVELQYAVLENLLQQQNDYAFQVFRDIINTEAPVLVNTGSDYDPYSGIMDEYLDRYPGLKDGKFLDELLDSIQLTRTILPDLLPLLNLEDYKPVIMELLGRMVDSNLVTAKDYGIYYSKFLIEAKQELKKQSIAEKKKAIEKAEENKTDTKKPSYIRTSEDEDDGNADLALYARLLLPFRSLQPAVGQLIDQMLRSGDKRVRYNTFLLLLENEQPYPDTMLNYFAGMDEYRFELYKDLKERNKMRVFPSASNNHIDLGRSMLSRRSSYGKPDSLVFLKKLEAEHKGKKGYVYFYKYKVKKDDLSWKLAYAGLTPRDPAVFEFEEPNRSTYWTYSKPTKIYSFTELSETKLADDEPLDSQLQKALKRLLYSRRESAKEFYKEEEEDTVDEE